MDIPWIGMEIEDEIGFGSYGRVYSVYLDDEEYALKVIKIPQDENETDVLLKTMGSMDTVKSYYHSIAEEFLKEIHIMQSLLGNPNIVSIKDFRLVEEEAGYTLFILMELLQCFADYEVEHQIDEKRAIEIGLDICNALTVCEENHVIHRDIKPGNILVDEKGICKICDFGVAKNMEKTMAVRSVKGTFSYMAPEVYHGKKYDNRADIYSLGMILHRLLNRGRDPFINPDAAEIRYKDKEAAINKRMDGEALPAPVDASPELSEVILKACAYYKEDRYTTAGKMKEDLVKVQEGRYRSLKKKKYGKLTSGDIIKRVLIACTVICLCCIIIYKAVDIQRDHQRFYNSRLKKKYEEVYYKAFKIKYGMQSYVDGHGTLFIFDDRDFINDYSYLDGIDGDDVSTYMSADTTYLYTDGAECIWEDKKADIKKIVISDGVKKIPDSVFKNYSNLEEVVLPSHLEYLGRSAFAACPKLRSVGSVSTIKELGEGCFIGSRWIEQKTGYIILGNCLIKYNGEKERIDDIPENIDMIADLAFADNSNIKTVLLPEGIRQIGSSAFKNCDSLTMIHMPDSVKTLGTELFTGCKNLGTIEMDFDWNKCTSSYVPRLIFSDTPWEKEHNQNGNVIDKNVLLYYQGKDSDDGKEKVDVIPENVTTIYSDAFSNNYIEKIILPQSVTRIMENAFSDNEALEEVELPEGLKEIGRDAFSSCLRLKDVIYAGDLKKVKVSGNPFYNTEFEYLHTRDGYFIYQDILFVYYGDKEVVDDVPKDVKVIQEYAFNDSKVKKVVLPDSVEQIRDGAFESCINLEKLIIPSSVKYLGIDLCWSCENLKEIRVPYHFTDQELRRAFPNDLDKIVKY